MKVFFNKRKSKLLLLTLLTLAVGASPAGAQEELTVYDGTTTCSYVPIYGYYVDAEGTSAQYIIPAEQLEDLEGGAISKLTYYLSSSPSWGVEYRVVLKEVSESSFETATFLDVNDATTVYEGAINITSNKLDINFTTNYVYNGGNLLIGFYLTKTGSYSSGNFYGQNVTNASVYSYAGWSGTSTNQQSFIPKTTFTYTPAAGTILKPTGLTISNVAATSATLTWTAGEATSWEVAVNTTGETPTEAGTVVSTATYDFTELTTETTYYAFVRVKDGDNYSKWSAPCEFIPSANTYLTVNEGTTTNNYVPIYGYFSAAANLGGQFIIPAANLTDVQNKVIKKLTFYSSTSEYAYGDAEFDVCIKEVDNATMTNSMYTWDDGSWTTVYSGTLAIVGGKMNITFTSDYSYNGSNLLVGIHKTSTDKSGSNYNVTFYGNNASSYISNYSPNGNRQKFQPKTTIGYQEKTGSELKVFDGETELTSPASFDFGLAEAGATHTFTLKNTAATPYEAAITSTNLTVAPAAVTPTAEGATFTVAMPAQDITNEAVVITPAAESGLEPFTINVSGTLRDATKLYVNDFTAQPTGWTADSWSFGATNGASTSTWNLSNNARLKSPMLTVVAGEKFIFEAKGTYESYQHLLLEYSADGTTWTAIGEEVSLTSAFQTFTVTTPNDFVAGNYYIALHGSQAAVRMFYGGEEVSGANFAINTDGTEQDFGTVKANATSEKTFTVTNNGNATLNVSFAATGDFTVTDPAALTVAAGESADFTVAMNTAEAGTKSGNVTLSFDALNATSFTIPCTGFVKDPNVLAVDFEDNAMPENWQVGSNWTVGSASGNHYAVQGATSLANATALVTTPLTVAEGETLTFKVCRNQSGSSSYKTSLQVRYSQDGGVNWSDYTTYYNNDDSNFGGSFTTKTVSDVPAGTVILEFYGCNIKLDDIEGFLKTTAPALALTEGTAAVANDDTKDFGNITANATATYTLKNIGNAEMTSTLSGEGVTISPASVTLAAGETADITVTMAYAEPYGAKTGTMTITTEGWVGDMTVNFKGEAVDPNSFVQDFEQNSKPAGWYSDGNWTYADGVARIYTGVAKSMITEKVAAEAGKNTLSFDAKIQAGGGDQTLSVYTSTDRQTWSEAQTFTLTSEMQTFTLNALVDGEYYVKFEALNAQVDNLKGLKKVALPEHDLFVTATELPTDQHFVETEVTATATVTSLISDETGVYAKLFVNDGVVATSDATNIALNATATLTMSYTPTEAGENTVYVVVYDGSDKVLFTSKSSTFEVKDYPTLTLDETATEAPSFETGTYNVTVNHRFVAGWNTICLPFEVNVSDIAEGAEAYSFDAFDAETKELTFNRVTTLDATTPYVIYVPQAIEKLEFKKQALNTIYANAGCSIHGGVTFQGTYTAVGSELSGCYGLTASGKIMKASATATMNGLRGYFKNVPAGARATFVADGTQGIRTISIDTTAPEGTYDLQGRRVEQLKRGGLYIKNGKKAMVK